MQGKTGDLILKDRERAKLAQDIEEFLNRGGVIEQLATGPRQVPPSKGDDDADDLSDMDQQD